MPSWPPGPGRCGDLVAGSGGAAAHRPRTSPASSRSEDSFVVQDYAHVDHLQVQKVEATELPLPGGVNRSSSVPHLFQVTLLHNSEGRQERILLSSDSA